MRSRLRRIKILALSDNDVDVAYLAMMAESSFIRRSMWCGSFSTFSSDDVVAPWLWWWWWWLWSLCRSPPPRVWFRLCRFRLLVAGRLLLDWLLNVSNTLLESMLDFSLVSYIWYIWENLLRKNVSPAKISLAIISCLIGVGIVGCCGSIVVLGARQVLVGVLVFVVVDVRVITG